MNKLLSEVYFLAGEIAIQMEAWMKKRDGYRTKLRFKPEDKVRLLRLKTWSMRHHISIAEILDMVMPVLTERSKWKKKYGFDITVRVLTGAASKKVLNFQLNKRYPAGENRAIWQEQEREAQLYAEKIDALEGMEVKPNLTPVIRADETTEEYMERYTKSVERARAIERKAVSQKWRRRKNYRNNPWL